LKKDVDEPKLSVKCSLCNTSANIITDQDSGEMICNNCGSINNFKTHYERTLYDSPNKENTNSKVMSDRKPEVLSRHDMRLSTVIGHI
jgi:transcription initiation factor TFIIB